MNEVKVWPHLAIVALVCAVLGGAAAMLWNKHKIVPEAQALTIPARIERVDGTVGLARALADEPTAQWIEVTPNTPLSVGDRLYVRDNSQAALAFTGRNFARLNPNSALDVLSLSERRTQLALRDGAALFDIGALAPGELFEVATPRGAIELQQPGLYQVGINDDGNTVVSVLSGLAQVVGLAGTGQLGKGEVLTLLGQTAAQVVLSRLAPQRAGALLNDYYGYRYPDLYDGRYSNYDAYLNDPYYYDPYNRSASYRYAPALIPGLADLDYYGDWQDVSGYGYAWRPRADAGWTPYQQGYWTMDDPYGLTWVSTEPWGYAPYHYGRWANAGGQWYWVPDGVNTRPNYAPALVAFVPLTEADEIGWVPLGPGDPYAPRYYSADWQPHYLTQTQVVQPQVVNLYVPGAVTVVPVQEFDRVFDRQRIKKIDSRLLANTRPVLDPLAHVALRQAALQTAIAHRGFVLPPGIARRLNDRQVIAGTAPVAPPFRKDKDLAKALRVAAVPEQRQQQRLQVRDERQARRDERQAALVQQPLEARADKAARRQEQQLQRQQQQAQRAAAAQAVGESARQAAAQRAQGERVGQQIRAQRQAERQQAIVAEQQQRAAQQQQRAVQQQQREAQRQTVIRPPQAQQPGRGHGAQQRAPEMRPQPAQQQRIEQRIERKQAPPPQAAQPQPGAPQPGGKGHGKGKRP